MVKAAVERKRLLGKRYREEVANNVWILTRKKRGKLKGANYY